MSQTPFLAGIDPAALSQCTFDRWQPGVGDPGFMGWFTVGCYVLTFLLSMRVFFRADPSRKPLRFFWLFLSILMLFLAINKQLDLQSFATAVARCVAKMQGWYDQRQGFQFKVILALGSVALAVGGFFFWKLRHDLSRNLLALLGLTVVFGFVLIRAVGFHGFDAIINTRISYVKINWILELSGLILISLNALILIKYSHIHQKRGRRRPHVNPVYRRPEDENDVKENRGSP